jgi:hypothetical protein
VELTSQEIVEIVTSSLLSTLPTPFGSDDCNAIRRRGSVLEQTDLQEITRYLWEREQVELDGAESTKESCFDGRRIGRWNWRRRAEWYGREFDIETE